ncbi:MAG TPA: citrate synthase/methylcitrate synthase [Hyphomonadaceae bacterium]|nr:citrate synthase/methylcitrate synthase [Hyphomonadaceae bacterium]HPN06608.1 citrate synthase/methylcitrate synthase [Hyphomonadaceae bacterium]
MDAGLEKVVAAETVLSDVQGAEGRLIIRGKDVEALVREFTFEQAAGHLWDGFFDATPELQAALGRARVQAFERLKPDFARLAPLPEVDALRAALSLAPDGHDVAAAIDLVATMAVATGAIAQMKAGRTPVAPDAGALHGTDLLRMIRGETPSVEEARALDAYLVTISDHGLNASTFVARCVASTRAGLGSAVIAGLSALKGPLHGGAPGPVLDMLDGIGAADRAEGWIRNALDRGERLMGFGHRVYRTRDPRADVLKSVVNTLPASSGRLALAQAIEGRILQKLAAEKPDRKLDTNVEYYTAILLEALGIPRGLFTCLFGCGRVTGWIAHAREQLGTGRLVRPASTYVGPMPVDSIAA